MPGFLNWVCDVLGYASCGAMSTFEAVIIAITIILLGVIGVGWFAYQWLTN